MPICLSCGYDICLYTDDPDSHFIEECWCGGYVIDRDLISEIITTEKSLRRTMALLQLNRPDDRPMINYAVVFALLDDAHIKQYAQSKGGNIVDYLNKIVHWVLCNAKYF